MAEATRAAGSVRYELRTETDTLIAGKQKGPFRIERVEVVGVFATREEARQHMIDTTEERQARDV